MNFTQYTIYVETNNFKEKKYIFQDQTNICNCLILNLFLFIKSIIYIM